MLTKTTYVKEQSGCEEKMFLKHIKEAVVFGEDVFTQQISHHYVSSPLRREEGTDWRIEKQGGKEGNRESPLCLSSEGGGGGTEGQRVEKERGKDDRDMW